MSNFACIGLVANERSDVEALLTPLIDAATPGPAVSCYWGDASGATLAVHGQKEVDCITPFFVSPSPTYWAVESTGALIDPGCLHCSGVDVAVLLGDEQVTQACVQLVEFVPYQEWLVPTRRWQLEVVCFASELASFPDQAAFAAREELGELRLASNGFLCMGVFQPEAEVRERAQALFAGEVMLAETRKNRATGADFVHAVVKTLMGAVTVVAPIELGVPPVGHLALVSGWLVGRPGDPPPPSRRKRWLGLF